MWIWRFSATTVPGRLRPPIRDSQIRGRLWNAGSAGDRLTGGSGADILSGGAGNDMFSYGSASESTSTGYDTVIGFDTAKDAFDLFFGVTGIDPTVSSGTLSTASFDTDLASALSGLGSHHAILFTPTAGSLAGHTFLVVDANGVAGYQAGADLVMDLQSLSGSLSTGNFI